MSGNGIVIHEKKLVYWDVAKCACTSIKAWLGRWMGFSFQKNSEVHSLPFTRTAEWNSYPNYMHFAVTRPPLERLYSLWRDKIKPDRITDSLYLKGVERDSLGRFYPRMRGGMSFEEFLFVVTSVPYEDCDPHFLPQRLCRPNSNIYLIEMRDLELKLNLLAGPLGMPVFREQRHVGSYGAVELESALAGLSTRARRVFLDFEEVR